MIYSTEKKAPNRELFSYTFETSLKKSLKDCGVTKNDILILAVSGGIDSMVMACALKSLYETFDEYEISNLRVLIVNHNIRDEKTSAQDAAVAFHYCHDILHLDTRLETIPVGEINSISKKRSKGIEEAARVERYRIIKEYAKAIYKKECSSFIKVCTAHHKSDQLESILMNFLKGSSSCGMRKMRKVLSFLFYCKPLLDFSREDVECYAKEKKVPFREDESNKDTVYLRNKMRHRLIPFLNQLYPGWDTAALKGAEKQSINTAAIKSYADSLIWIKKNSGICVESSYELFLNSLKAVRIEMLFNGLKVLGIKKTIPYRLIEQAASIDFDFLGDYVKRDKILCEGCGISICANSKSLFIKKTREKLTDIGFFVIIDSCGAYPLRGGTLFVFALEEESYSLYGESLPFVGNLPLLVRSRRVGDTVLCKDNNHKSLKKLFSDWGVDEEESFIIPLIKELDGSPISQIDCVLGSAFGYCDWVVKATKNDFSLIGKKVGINFIKD